MAENKKDLEDFLSGKGSEEGKRIFDTWYHSVPEKDHPELEASEEKIQAELKNIKTRKVATLPTTRREFFSYWKAAAIALVILSAGISLYIWKSASKDEQPLTSYSVPRGKLLHLSLSDGSQVWLNAETQFRCPEKFGDDAREVYLEGEAFFEVTKDPSKPFRIHSGPLTTTVLGTSFNVKAYGAEDINEVAVITGKVSVAQTVDNKPSSEVTLQPGQKAVLTKSTAQLSKENFSDMSHYTSWRDGKLIFEDTPVKEVIASLGRRYNIDIHLTSEALQDCRVTATFDPMPLEKVMYLLCFTLNAEYSRKGDDYSITGVGCNPF
jgi:ferric-dicitrate binding protein FerR (iron transport regulator)